MPKFIQSMKRTSSVQKALEFKGVGFAVSKAAKFINNKSVAFVASTFVFLEFCPLITRPFEEIYFSAKLGNSLAKTEADLATYKNFEKSIPNYMSLIEIFSQESSKWRAHWQAPVKAKMQAWLDYISQLQNNYFSSKLFYHELVSRLSVPNPQDRLFVAHPYNGIDEHASFEAIAQKIVNAVRLAEKKIKNIQALGSKASENQIQTVSFMSSIISSLLSIDDQRPPNVALQAQYEKIRRTPSLLESQRERLKNEARQNEFVVGIKLLQKLASDSVFGPLGFIEVNEILKGAHPLARGEFELERMDRNSHLIIQDTKENSKMNIGNVVAHSKAEYLLAEFVCGRKALIREYWGIGVYYHPPQMTIPQSFDYCEIRPENISQSENSWGVTGSIYKGRDGTEVDGLIGLATQYLRPEFRGREGVTHFENFWESSVEPQVKAKTAQKNNEFSKLLNSDLVPILNDDSIHHSHGVSLPKGTYSSLEHEFSVYISILKEIKQKYKLPMDIGSVQIIFDRQARLLKKKETFAEVLKSFSLTEIDKVSKKLTLALTDFKNIDAKKTERTKIQALSEFLDDKMDLAFGTLIETSASRPEIIPLMIFLKIKIKGIEVQFENLVALEDALQVSGL